ncbi:MAG: formylglycine-generating enzyme family protein [Bauldia sp.]
MQRSAAISMRATFVAGLVLLAAILAVPADAQPAACAGVVAKVGAPAESRCVKPQDRFRDCAAICPEMVVVPAGTFTMGSPANEKDHDDDEGPTHEVVFAVPFAVGRIEVTRGEFSAFVADSGHKVAASCFVLGDGWASHEKPGKSFRDPEFEQDDGHPATCVSFSDAKAYVAWLAAKTGAPYRLLSEAEWEYADRAGAATPFPFGDPGRQCAFANAYDLTLKLVLDVADVAACTDNFAHTAPGASFAANAFGLYDMPGNVWEWTEDCYHSNYNGAPRDGTAWTAGECRSRVLRGGSWGAFALFLRSAARFPVNPALANNTYGFRVARSLGP